MRLRAPAIALALQAPAMAATGGTPTGNLYPDVELDRAETLTPATIAGLGTLDEIETSKLSKTLFTAVGWVDIADAQDWLADDFGFAL